MTGREEYFRSVLPLQLEVQSWREYAEHLEHCVQCGQTSPDDCFDGERLRAVAHARSDERAAALSSTEPRT